VNNDIGVSILIRKSIIIGVFGFLISTSIFVYAIKKIGFFSLMSVLSELQLAYCLSALALLTLSIIVSSIRYGYLNKVFGADDVWQNIYYTSCISILYSQLAQPLLAQIIGRILHSNTTRPETLVPITIIEKIISLTIMLLIAVAAAYGIFNSLMFKPSLFIGLAFLTLVALISSFIVCFTLLTGADLKKVKRALKGLLQSGLITTLTLSTIIHILTILTFVILTLQFNPEATFIKLFGAFSLVVLATAIPVGIGGWGVREASAFGVFNYYGMQSDLAVVASIILGLLFLFSLALNTFVGKFLSRRKTVTVFTSKHYTLENLWISGSIFLAMAVPFNFRIPTETSMLSLNLADPLAFLMGTSMVVHLIVKKDLKNIWITNGVWLAIGCFAAMISLGWLVGFFRFGSNDWATFNRLFGLIVIGSYLFSGVVVANVLSCRLAILIGNVILLSLCVGVIVEILIKPYFNPNESLGLELLQYFNWGTNLAGFTGDPNAFAFLITMVAAYVIFSPVKVEKNWQTYFAITTLGMSLWFCFYGGSRAGFGALVVLFFGIVTFKPMINIKFLITGIVLGILVTQLLHQILYFSSFEYFNASYLMGGRTELNEILKINDSRMNTWLSGLEMARDHPILGGGLGAILENHDLVVHNGLIWILAEMGVVGVILVFPLVLVIIKRIFRGGNLTTDRSKQTILIVFVIFGGFSLVQDILYQRILWFVFGVTMALPNLKKE
jgi:glycosyltransferase 2 family protein